MSITVTPIPRLLSLVAPNFGIGTSNVAGTASTAVSSNSTLGFLATQAEMEAASVNTAFATPGRTQFHPGVAKTWVTYDYEGGTLVNKASYNVASLVDTGTGDVKVNFTTNMSSVHYSMVGMPQATRATMNAAGLFTNYCSAKIWNSSDALADIDGAIALFGDQE